MNVKLPKDSIINSKTALDMHGVLNFSFSNIYLNMKVGTNINKILISNPTLVIKKQVDKQLNIGITEIHGKKIYSVERLLLKLNTFELSKDQYEYSLKNLLQKIDINKLNKIIENLKFTNDDKRIYEYIQKKNFNLIEQIILKSSNPREKDKFLRLYISSRIEDISNVFLLKGGTVMDIIFPGSNRATKDVDGYLATSNYIYKKIIEELQINKDGIEIIVHELKNEILNKKIKIDFKYLIGNEYKIDSIEIDLNTALNKSEIIDIKKEFSIQKIFINEINSSVNIISLEQFLIEKIDQLFWRKENASRTKDLIDIFMIYKKYSFDNLNNIELKKWFEIKNKISSRINRRENYLKELKSFELIESPKIKETWIAQVKAFDLDENEFEYLEAYMVFKKLIKILDLCFN